MAHTTFQPQPLPPNFAEGIYGKCSFYISPDQPFPWADWEVFTWSVLSADDQHTFIEESAPSLACAEFCATYAAHYLNQTQPPALSGVLSFPPAIYPSDN